MATRMRWITIIVGVLAVYITDATVLHGQLSREASEAVRNAGTNFNQQVTSLMRPLRR
jgi:hypothetical protein